jgi:hypothetical protein
MLIGKNIIHCTFESGKEGVNISKNGLFSWKTNTHLCTLCKQKLEIAHTASNYCTLANNSISVVNSL